MGDTYWDHLFITIDIRTLRTFYYWNQQSWWWCTNGYNMNVGSCFIKSPKQHLETYCFCSVSYYYSYSSLSFFAWTMNLSTADLRKYWTEFHETWWSYRYMYMFLVFSFELCGKGGQSHILRGSKGVGVTIYRILWES